MNRYFSPKRLYRKCRAQREGEVGFQVVLEQTDLFIVARKDLSAEALDIVRQLRGVLKAYIAMHPEFATSLLPVAPAPGAHEMIADMCRMSEICNVGPMAAVAGAIAQRVAEALLPLSPDVLVENGGDIHLCSTRDRNVGLLQNPEAGADLGIHLPRESFPVSICSSSATIGHSLSLGRGELVVVRSPNACLADAAATGLCNMIREARDLDRVLKRGQALCEHGIEGVLAMMEGNLGIWGELELVAL